jgi:hypothetical protein
LKVSTTTTTTWTPFTPRLPGQRTWSSPWTTPELLSSRTLDTNLDTPFVSQVDAGVAGDDGVVHLNGRGEEKVWGTEIGEPL